MCGGAGGCVEVLEGVWRCWRVCGDGHVYDTAKGLG